MDENIISRINNFIEKQNKKYSYIDKIMLPSGKVKYIYPKENSPQRKYYYSEKGQKSQINWRHSPSRKKYLSDYYKKNKEKMIENAMKRYKKLKEEKQRNNFLEKPEMKVNLSKRIDNFIQKYYITQKHKLGPRGSKTYICD